MEQGAELERIESNSASPDGHNVSQPAQTNSTMTLRKTVQKNYEAMDQGYEYLFPIHKYSYCLKISMKKAMSLYPERAEEAIKKELSGLIKMKTFSPISPSEARTSQTKQIRTFMFLKEKYKADGSFDKLKARLVADGSKQDRDLYQEFNISAPTAGITVIFMTLMLAKYLNFTVQTFDIPSAFMHASHEKSGLPQVIISFDPDITSFKSVGFQRIVEGFR